MSHVKDYEIQKFKIPLIECEGSKSYTEKKFDQKCTTFTKKCLFSP